MYEYPKKYAIPIEEYTTESRINEKRLNVARVVKDGVIDFLFKIGQLGQPNNGTLLINLSVFNELLESKKKKIKSNTLFDALLQLGLQFHEGAEVVVTNKKYIKMLLALSYLAKACSKDKKNGLRHFCRCDFRILGPTFSLDMTDLLKLLQSSLSNEVSETDCYLKQMKFRRKIECYGDFGFRISYSNKVGVVYYCHINSYETKNFFHYIRWILDTSQTTKLFQKLSSDSPEISQYVFDNMNRCDPECIPGYGTASPESCMARIKIVYNGKSFFTCKDYGWNKMGITPNNFSILRTVLKVMHEVIFEKD